MRKKQKTINVTDISFDDQQNENNAPVYRNDIFQCKFVVSGILKFLSNVELLAVCPLVSKAFNAASRLQSVYQPITMHIIHAHQCFVQLTPDDVHLSVNMIPPPTQHFLSSLITDLRIFVNDSSLQCAYLKDNIFARLESLRIEDVHCYSRVLDLPNELNGQLLEFLTRIKYLTTKTYILQHLTNGPATFIFHKLQLLSFHSILNFEFLDHFLPSQFPRLKLISCLKLNSARGFTNLPHVETLVIDCSPLLFDFGEHVEVIYPNIKWLIFVNFDDLFVNDLQRLDTIIRQCPNLESYSTYCFQSHLQEAIVKKLPNGIKNNPIFNSSQAYSETNLLKHIMTYL